MTPKVRVLIIEDDPDYIQQLQLMFQELSHSYECDYLMTYDEGLQGVLQNQHDIYLVDYLLDLGNTGDSLIDEAARRSSPVVMLTGVDDFKLRERMLRAGASDYIIKNEINTVQLDAILRKALHHENG